MKLVKKFVDELNLYYNWKTVYVKEVEIVWFWKEVKKMHILCFEWERFKRKSYYNYAFNFFQLILNYKPCGRILLVMWLVIYYMKD